MKYGFMKAHHGKFRLTAMLNVLGVSSSGYYDWLNRGISTRQYKQQYRDRLIRCAFEQSKRRSGSPNIWRDLCEAGHHCNLQTVAKSMQRQGLRAKAARKFKVTTSAKHKLPVAPNLLKQDFYASRPNQKWVGDITYLWTNEGWLYLATVIDLYSRAVIGWSLSHRIDTQLVSDTLMMALWRRHFPKNVIVHSDRGSQYCSKAYQQLLKDYQLVCSMSGKGNCYDNAVAESFFHTLKVEAIHGERFVTRQQLRQAIFEYIEVDYNRHRRHSAANYLPPMIFEQQFDKVS